MKYTTLNIKVREELGKNKIKPLRHNGYIPGVLYGGQRGNLSICIKENEIVRALNQGHFLSKTIQVKHQEEKQTALVKDIQFHPVTDQPLHLDLFRVEEDTIIAVEIPVRFLNEDISPGLKRGGSLNIVRHSIEVNCPAGKIPEFIDVDLKESDIGDSIHISHIQLQEHLSPTIQDRDFTIVTLVGARAELTEDQEVEEETEAPTEETEQEEPSS